MVTIHEALQAGTRHHRAGQFGEAERLYRQVLQLEPDHAHALFLLGTLAIQVGQFTAAVELITSAIRSDRARPDFHVQLGEAYWRLGNFERAVSCAQHALKLNPQFPQAYASLGQIHKQAGNLAEAEDAIRQVMRISPEDVEARLQLAVVLIARKKLSEAETCLRRALRIAPQDSRLHYNLGIVLQTQDRFDEAVTSYRATLELNPEDAEAHNNLGASLQRLYSVPDAEAHYRHAIRIKPDDPKAHNNLATCLQSQGRVGEAIESYRTAVQLRPEDPYMHSNLLYILNYDPADLRAVFAEHRRWAERHADPLSADSLPHENDRTPDRRLRVGYVSSHFRAHAVNYFSEPILASHDHGRFEVFCYSNANRVNYDGATERLQQYADHWRDIANMSDLQASEIVRQDRIDILVDLAGHIGGGRLLVFARKPAPVQVTYIGYQNTTGMAAMDYRLTDAWSDPPGTTDDLYTERLVRLPRSFFCYQPLENAPDVTPSPVVENRVVTFGSFNNLAKVTSKVLDAWGRLMAAVPQSRLIVLAAASPWVQNHLQLALARHGVDATRIEICNRRPAREFLELIARADIALDPFPFNGHTTTCDSLWMGVPVIMMAGQSYASRFGSSALVNLGLEELIASSIEEYVEIACRLAGDQTRLAKWRSELRTLMTGSALLDAKGFTRNLEAAYHEMWARWCSS